MEIMEAYNAFRKHLCQINFAILVVLITTGLTIINSAHAHNVSIDLQLPAHDHYDNTMTAFNIPTTSTIRPWPSDKFLRKVLGSNNKRRNHHLKKAEITSVRRRPSNHRPTLHHENIKKYSWSHYHAKHDTNLYSENNKLNINNQDATRLTNQTKLDHHTNQSIDNMQSHNKPPAVVDNTQKHEFPSLHTPQKNSSINNSIIRNENDVNEGKNLPGTSSGANLFQQHLQDDADQKDIKVNYERPAVQNNYGIGFQYEISPYPTHSHFSHRPIFSTATSKKPMKQRITSTSTVPTTTLQTTIIQTTEIPTNTENNEPEMTISPTMYAERSGINNAWKKIPTLTVTIRPLGELYSSSSTSFPSKRTKTKRPQWGFGSSTTHAHYPFPFKTRITTTPPPPSVTFAHLEFDTPASPSPLPPSSEFIQVTPRPGFDFDNNANFGFPTSQRPPSVPFSPFNTVVAPTFSSPQQQHVHIRPHFETFSQPQQIPIRPSDISAIQSSSSSSLTRPFTNIWYKPIINHFISAAAAAAASSASSSDLNIETPIINNDFSSGGLIFKVWNYNKNGKLTLVNENVIPTTALEGFQLENGAILNFDQIPLTVQDSVASAISEFNHNQDNFLQPFEINHHDYGFEPSIKRISGDDSGSKNGYETQAQPSHIETRPKLERKYVNYVIVEKRTNDPPNLDNTYAQEHNIFQGGSIQAHEHRSSTTYRPQQMVDNEESAPTIDQSWQQLHNLLLSVKDIRLPTPVERDSLSVTSPPTPPTNSDSSHQTEKIGNKQLMADMAAIAILISYLKNRTHNAVSPQNQSRPSSTPPNPPIHDTATATTIPSSTDEEEEEENRPDFSIKNKNALQIYQYLLQQLKYKTDFQTKTRKNPTTTEEPDPEPEPEPEPDMEDYENNKPQKHKSMLLMKGLVKKGVKKKIKKKLAKPLAHIFKHPKEYWFDFKFDVDIYDILKKKFLYYLALKYMPVALVVALKLVPLALLMIPILWKIYWVKKKPKYIRVPYPVYKYVKQRPSSSWQHYHNDFEGSSSSRPIFPKFPFQIEEFLTPNNPYHHPPPPPIVLKTAQDDDNLGPHPIDVQNEVNRFNNLRPPPQSVTHAYELGFDLGSKLGTYSDNDHDPEVLKILIESRKDKIKRLLKKWNLFRSGDQNADLSTTPIQRLGHFVSHQDNINIINGTKKFENVEYNNEIPLDEKRSNKEMPFVKKRKKRK